LLALEGWGMPEFRADYDPAAERSKCLTDELLVDVRAIHLSRVEEGEAAIDGGANKRDHFAFVGKRSIAVAHAHTAQTKGRHLKIAAPEYPLVHRGSVMPVAGRCCH